MIFSLPSISSAPSDALISQAICFSSIKTPMSLWRVLMLKDIHTADRYLPETIIRVNLYLLLILLIEHRSR